MSPIPPSEEIKRKKKEKKVASVRTENKSKPLAGIHLFDKRFKQEIYMVLFLLYQ